MKQLENVTKQQLFTSTIATKPTTVQVTSSSQKFATSQSTSAAPTAQTFQFNQGQKATFKNVDGAPQRSFNDLKNHQKAPLNFNITSKGFAGVPEPPKLWAMPQINMSKFLEKGEAAGGEKSAWLQTQMESLQSQSMHQKMANLSASKASEDQQFEVKGTTDIKLQDHFDKVFYTAKSKSHLSRAVANAFALTTMKRVGRTLAPAMMAQENDNNQNQESGQMSGPMGGPGYGGMMGYGRGWGGPWGWGGYGMGGWGGPWGCMGGWGGPWGCYGGWGGYGMGGWGGPWGCYGGWGGWGGPWGCYGGMGGWGGPWGCWGGWGGYGGWGGGWGMGW